MGNDDSIRSARRWSAATVVWTSASSSAAIVGGSAVGSLSLVAFGCVGLLDVISSVALVLHFRRAVRHQAVSHDRDRWLLAFIALAMTVLALATAAAAVLRLAHHSDAPDSLVGIFIAGPSVVALTILGRAKRRIGHAVGSPALAADGTVSLLGAVLAGITLTGVAVENAAGWWWLDPVASLFIAAGALGLAIASVRRAPETAGPASR